MIIAGHGRVDALKLLGMKTVPTICLENLNEDQIRAYILADTGWPRKRTGTTRFSRSSCSI